MLTNMANEIMEPAVMSMMGTAMTAVAPSPSVPLTAAAPAALATTAPVAAATTATPATAQQQQASSLPPAQYNLYMPLVGTTNNATSTAGRMPLDYYHAAYNQAMPQVQQALEQGQRQAAKIMEENALLQQQIKDTEHKSQVLQQQLAQQQQQQQQQPTKGDSKRTVPVSTAGESKEHKEEEQVMEMDGFAVPDQHRVGLDRFSNAMPFVKDFAMQM